jgi:hypothetical protein
MLGAQTCRERTGTEKGKRETRSKGDHMAQRDDIMAPFCAPFLMSAGLLIPPAPGSRRCSNSLPIRHFY